MINRKFMKIYLDIIRNPATSGIINLGNAISEHEPDLSVELSNE
jgi:hypothetical protein